VHGNVLLAVGYVALPTLIFAALLAGVAHLVERSDDQSRAIDGIERQLEGRPAVDPTTA
jgi:hypothetical protein